MLEVSTLLLYDFGKTHFLSSEKQIHNVSVGCEEDRVVKFQFFANASERGK